MKPQTCRGCPLETRGRGFVCPEGIGKVMLIGDAPGNREVIQGKPFVGEAGLQLGRILARMRVDRSKFSLTNVLACQPPNNWLEGAPWERQAVGHCGVHLREAIERIRPKVLVPMGNVPLRTCLPRPSGISDARGYVFDAMVHGLFVHVVPTYNPAFILRGEQRLTGVLMDDLAKALRVSERGYVAERVTYVERPTPDDAAAFAEEASSFDAIAADIETERTAGLDEEAYSDTVDSDIIRISFSFRPNYAITIPWRKDFFPVIHKLMSRRVVYWNADFDVPRLRAQNCPVGRTVEDAMWEWHFLQPDLPKGLGFVASLLTDMQEWKSLSSTRPEYYSCADADATIRCWLEIENRLQAEGRLQAWRDRWATVPILQHMSSVGVMFSKEQHARIEAQLRERMSDIDRRIQEVVPAELKPAKKYKKPPAGWKVGDEYRGGVWEEGGILRFRFNPSSPKHMQAYIRYRQHVVPYDRRTGAPTTAKLSLEQLHRQHPSDPLYSLVVDYRECQKMITQYIEGYRPGPDGAIHTRFTFSPAVGRLASEHPNVQNIPKHSQLAEEYRRQFVARPGHLLVEFDYRAIQAVLVAWLAKDDEYLRACKLGAHGILATYVLGNPVDLSRPDDEIKEIVSSIKRNNKELYDQCKHVTYGSAFGGSAMKLRISFPEVFPTLKDAEQLQETYFRTIGKRVRAWQNSVVSSIERVNGMAVEYVKPYIDTPFGIRRYFYDVWEWDAKGRRWTWSSAAKEALAFQPQAIEAGIVLKVMRRLPRDLQGMLRWQIHDALLFEIPKESLAENIRRIVEVMEMPHEELDGLSIEVEVSVGENWGDMRPYVLGSVKKEIGNANQS